MYQHPATATNKPVFASCIWGEYTFRFTFYVSLFSLSFGYHWVSYIILYSWIL